MDYNEKLYEISLKYNTLKMYENTLSQMRKNGNSKSSSFERINKEKEETENELLGLLKIDNENADVDKNKFIEKVTNKEKLYCNNFFDSIDSNDYELEVDDEQDEENDAIEKPKFSDIQEKISASQWIGCQNFIVKFPRRELNIDEWRVSSFNYYLNTDRVNSKCISGELEIVVNDFSYADDNGNNVILSKMIEDMYRKPSDYSIGNIYVNIVDCAGNELHTISFTKCKFVSANFSDFDYSKSDLRKVIIHFYFEDVNILSPDEASN